MRKNREAMESPIVLPLQLERSRRKVHQGMLSIALLLKLLIFLLASIVPALRAFATSFGPVPLAGQIEHSDYVLHGVIRGQKRVELEPRTRRPYTYWHLEVTSQSKGVSLGETVALRQPGGEIGDMGYSVASSAVFSDGEEVVVMVNDTNQAGVKELLGLANGKYTVEHDSEGREVLRNGLGFLLLGPDGKEMNVKSLEALARRVETGKATDADRGIFLNRNMDHRDEFPPGLVAGNRSEDSNQSSRKEPANTPGGAHEQANNNGQLDSVQKAAASADTDVSGGTPWGWLLLAVAVSASALGGYLWIRKR